MLVLHVLQGPDRGMKFELPAHEPQLIGRSSEALPINDTTVSRRHAELTPDDGQWYLRDLESANGTFVNGQRVTSGGRIRLSPGDQIRCGSTLFVFGITKDDAKSSAVQLLDGSAFDISVEAMKEARDRPPTIRAKPSAEYQLPKTDSRKPTAVAKADPNEDSMVLAAPDFAKAASDHLRIIYELTAITASVFERDELLSRIMDLIFTEFEPDRGFILLQESWEARPEPVVVRYKVKPKTVDEGRIPVSRTIVQHTLQKAQGILSTNAMNDSRFRSGDSVQEYGIRTAICVPIRSGKRIFGVIHIDSSLANFTFTEGQLDLMNAIGQHAGLAMLSAELIQTKMHNERLAAMGQTVASLSHSIKNILQGLRGGADAVELALKREDVQMAREGWPIMSRNLDRIFALTLNMLAYSKQRSLDIELGSINALVEEVVQLVQVQCREKNVGIIMDLADDMPPMPIDANALHQALINVVVNAIEAAGGGTTTLRVVNRDAERRGTSTADSRKPSRGLVTISTRFIDDAEVGGQEAQIIIVDDGPGVPVEIQEKIFDAFMSSKGQRGTGLGLAVAKKIITEHGGRIVLQSKPGQGATFTITIPSDHTRLSASETRLPRPMSREALEDEFE